MKKKITREMMGGALVVLVGMAGWYWGSRSLPQEEGEKLHAVATFFPLTDWASIVGSDRVSVTQIVPEGAEPHDFEPSPRDIEKMLSADVVLMNGGGIDTWAEEFIPEITASGGVIVRMSDVVPFIEGDEHEDDATGHEEEEAHEEENHNHEEGGIDPHAWLDLARAQQVVHAIAEAFITKDQDSTAVYTASALEFQEELKELDAKFFEMLKSCEKNAILVTHDAFSYWELRYGMNITSISGISPEIEPSVQDLARITEQAKEQNITTIFFESPASTATATTIAEEIGASVDVLYPLEGRTQEQIAAGATYTDIMEQNLSALSRALTCTNP